MSVVKMARSQLEIRKEIIKKWTQERHKSKLQIAREVKTAYCTVRNVVKCFEENQSIDLKKKPGRPKGAADPKLSKRIVTILKKKKSMSVRDVAKKAGCSVGLIQKTKKLNNMKTYKKQKVPKRSPEQLVRAKDRAKRLRAHLIHNPTCIVMDDESYFKMDFSTLAGPQYYTITEGEVIPESEKHIKMEKFGSKVLVWQTICACGQRSTPFFIQGTIRAEVYQKECLQKRLLPFLRNHVGPTIFWPDLATAHYAKATLDWFGQNNINFVPKDMNPPNVPELRPIERYWALVKAAMRKSGQSVTSMQEFKNSWTKYSKTVTSTTIKNLMMNILTKMNNFTKGITIK